MTPRKSTTPSPLRRLMAIAVFAVASAGSNVSADLTFAVATPINGTTPLGTLNAAFVDNGAGIVDLTMTSNLSNASEFISHWGFNYVSTFTDVSNLAVIFQSSTGTVRLADTVNTTLNNGTFHPPSVGKFDLVFAWTGSDHSFGPSSSITYELIYTGSQTFNSSTFDATSSGGSISGAPFYSAAKIQGIPRGGQSGELGNNTGPGGEETTQLVVPEPSTLAIAGLGGSASWPTDYAADWRSNSPLPSTLIGPIGATKR